MKEEAHFVTALMGVVTPHRASHSQVIHCQTLVQQFRVVLSYMEKTGDAQFWGRSLLYHVSITTSNSCYSSGFICSYSNVLWLDYLGKKK